MCEGLLFLLTGFWEIVRTALGIALGTALAWYWVVGPILRQNDRRKKEETIIEETIELVCHIDSKITNIAENRPPNNLALSELNQKVHKFTDHVRHKIRSSIPGLADALHTPVNRLINGTRPPAEIEESTSSKPSAAASSYVDRLMTEVPETCQLLITTLSEHKRDALQLSSGVRISCYYRALKRAAVWQNLVERLR
jgi:hypothetical protein